MLVLLAERADTRNYTGERPEVPQADGLPEQPNQPASTDQQSCGADQPYVSLLGEGAVQVAASKDAGPVRGPDTRRRLERLGTPNGTRGRSLKTRQTRQGATPSQTSITSSRVIIWWRSVRSLSFCRVIPRASTFNGATSMKTWKRALLPLTRHRRSTPFNGATSMKTWKRPVRLCKSHAVREPSM